LAQAAQRGITVCAASGDFGAYTDDGQIGVVYPASSAWVLSCGGTQHGHTDRRQEEVWSSRAGASGGGESKIIPRPRWQTSLPGRSESPGRLIPDVAALASGPGWAGQLAVGTSAAAPLWAGLIACANQAIRLQGGIHRVGHVTHRLYDPASGLRDALHNITTGRNAVTHGPACYQAQPGWDACTGWGAPIPQALLAKLAASPSEAK
jgi:kumamolisin